MGQLIEGLPSLTQKSTTTKHIPIDIDLFIIKSSNDIGNIVTRLSDNSNCFLCHRDLQQSAVSSKKEMAMNSWLSQEYKNSCNIVQYELKSRSLLCNTQITLKILLQYGNSTLHQMLLQKNDNGGLEISQITRFSEVIRFDSPLERMSFLKQMLDIVDEQRQKNKIWIGFHTKNLIYFPKEKMFKLFYLLNLEESTFNEYFFSPETEAGQEPTQQCCVFSMGMVLLSLFLGEDCSDCYNYQNFAFCQSIFEDKIQRLKEGMITKGLMGILDDQSRYLPQFDEEISELILLMTAKAEERLCFAEVKRRYLCLIRKASYSYNGHDHTRSVLQPLTSKRVRRGRTKSRPHPTIGCFSTNEDFHFRTTITEADQSDFFAISKSNVAIRDEKPHKDNQALRWKKAITNRMKEHKENMPFYEQY